MDNSIKNAITYASTFFFNFFKWDNSNFIIKFYPQKLIYQIVQKKVYSITITINSKNKVNKLRNFSSVQISLLFNRLNHHAN